MNADIRGQIIYFQSAQWSAAKTAEHLKLPVEDVQAIYQAEDQRFIQTMKALSMCGPWG